MLKEGKCELKSLQMHVTAVTDDPVLHAGDIYSGMAHIDHRVEIVQVHFINTLENAYLIFVTGGARGEKICHVEKFQISAHDRCGEI